MHVTDSRAAPGYGPAGQSASAARQERRRRSGRTSRGGGHLVLGVNVHGTAIDMDEMGHRHDGDPGGGSSSPAAQTEGGFELFWRCWNQRCAPTKTFFVRHHFFAVLNGAGAITPPVKPNKKHVHTAIPRRRHKGLRRQTTTTSRRQDRHTESCDPVRSDSAKTCSCQVTAD